RLIWGLDMEVLTNPLLVFAFYLASKTWTKVTLAVPRAKDSTLIHSAHNLHSSSYPKKLEEVKNVILIIDLTTFPSFIFKLKITVRSTASLNSQIDSVKYLQLARSKQHAGKTKKKTKGHLSVLIFFEYI
ncbi:hypothetical protein ACJX0J_026233, partial [Zea mays]